MRNPWSVRAHIPKPRGQRGWRDAAALVLAVLVGGIGVQLAHTTSAAPVAASPPHVLLVMEENKGYTATLGTCSADPYFCSLASTYASATDWWGVRHPSEPNYLASTTGGTQGCASDTCFKTLTVPSVGGQLTAAGIPWTAYMESMPSACYTGQWFGGVDAGAKYAEKHDPFVVEGDVLNNGCASHVLPYPGASSMLSTLDGSSPPAFVWITPNQQDDMHSGSVTAGDNWLKANLAPVLSSPWFTGFNSTVIVTMDEGTGKNDCCGVVGGQIPTVVISNNAKGVGHVTTPGDHYGTLRSIEEAFGLPLLGSAANAGNGDLSALFGSSGPPPTPTPTTTPTGTPSPTPTATPTPTPSPTPNPSTVQCSGDITSALQAAVDAGGTVTISAGTCALSNHIVVSKAGTTVEGAGPTSTFLVQHSRVNIFQIVAPGVTIEDMNVDTATFNPGVPPIQKNPVPGTIFSSQSNTSVIDLSSEAGTGFGMRLTGPNPCQNHLVSGDVVSNVSSTNTGTGGFTALDMDCLSSGTASDVTIHGDYLALYQSSNVTITDLTVTPGPYEQKCGAPLYVTGPANGDSAINVFSYGGHIITHGTRFGNVTNFTVTNFQFAPGDTCKP